MKTLHRRLTLAAVLVAAWTFYSPPANAEPAPDIVQIAESFTRPAEEHSPWVYWFWSNGNLSKEGVTADLEAMKRVGIKGVLIMEVSQGAPKGPYEFMGDRWRELFRFMIEEAARLDIKVNMNNDPGWNGTGGFWIKPEDGMQVLTWSETVYTHPNSNSLTMPRPQTRLDHYHDIAVLAFPTPKDLKSKEPVDPNRNNRSFNDVTPQAVVAVDRIIDVTDKMAPNGILDWTPPSGGWTLLRIGHTCKGNNVYPAPDAGRGLECDKLSKKSVKAAFDGQIGRLVAENRKHVGTTFVSTHIDSWENGSQNWTPLMREEFLRRRGYDLLPYLPVFMGYVVGGEEITERFLWDFRATVSEMVLDNYVRHFYELSHDHGLGLTIEAYGSPCDFLEYGGIADEPMGEFWLGTGHLHTSARAMASAGHIYGRKIIGAEAFTAGRQERWLDHPGSIKALGDMAFAEGINRFVFHRYSFQPWNDVRPGVTMGPWGVHYERTQTWWERTTAWHDYLARCQYLLKQGDYVADICYLEPENAPQTHTGHSREGYAWDQCGTHAMMTMSVRDGRIVLPGGMSYAILVLPKSERMTLRLLEKTFQLIRQGATVLGSPPTATYGLVDFPNNEKRLKELVTRIWGEERTPNGERRIEKGRIIWGHAPEGALAGMGVPPDFRADRELNRIHRRIADADIYFVANPKKQPVTAKAYFRATGVPEIWHPETGKRIPAPVVSKDKAVTGIMLSLKPTESVFLIFRDRKVSAQSDPITAISRDGETIVDLDAVRDKIEVKRATYGTRDVTELVAKKVENGYTSIDVDELVKSFDKKGARLQVEYRFGTFEAVVSAKDRETLHLSSHTAKVRIFKATYGPKGDEARTLDVTGLLQDIFNAGENGFLVSRLARPHDPAYGVVKTLTFDYEFEGRSGTWTGDDRANVVIESAHVTRLDLVPSANAAGEACLDIHTSGEYEFKSASGKTVREKIDLPSPSIVEGAWQVSFPKKKATFEKLISWSESDDESIRYFSGTAVYRRSVEVPKEFFAPGRRILLDLGRVECIAELKIDGKSLGTLWTLEKSLDVTDHLKPGVANELEISVTNLWPNRLIGDDRLPPDSERNPNGTLVKWPDWLLEGKPNPSGRETFCMWNLWSKDDPLIPSGLIGPVRFVPVRRMTVK